MAEVYRLRSRSDVEGEASEWIARLEADDVTTDDRSQFAQWLAKGSTHRETFEDMRRTWHRLDALAHLGDGRAAAAAGAGRRAGRIPGWVGVLAAGLGIVAIGVGAWLAVPSDVVRYETVVGHQSTVSLADGSVVQLNTDTLVYVRYTESQRLVELARGEAHFDVKSDRTRPFVVEAGGRLVQAVGTSFNVLVSPDKAVEVTVTEGVVEIRPPHAADPVSRKSEPALATLTRNQRAEYGPSREPTRVDQLPDEQIERQMAWRAGMLLFDGERLEQVVAEVSRYTDFRFEFADPTLRDVRVGGYFRATDTDAFLELLHAGLAIDARRTGKSIFLTRAHLTPPGL